MSIDTSIWREFLIQLPVIITALGAVVLGWRNGKKVDAVHTVVNNQNTALITKNENLYNENTALRQDKADIIKVASSAPVDPDRLPK